MINKALLLIRDFHGMRQSELAKQFEISSSYLSEIERGHKDPSLELLAKYEKYFGIPVSSILLFSETLASAAPSEQVRFSAGKKVIQLLEWLTERKLVNEQA
jgi:transcriptional regulator with XRE-family HTH domain